MAEPGHPAVTLDTLHGDLTSLRGDLTSLHEGLVSGFREMRAGFGDLKATLIAGFSGLPSRESSEEMVRLLREGNRLQEARVAQLDVRIRERHLQSQEVLHALAEGQRSLTGEVRNLAADIKALIARLDALIRGRGDGSPTS